VRVSGYDDFIDGEAVRALVAVGEQRVFVHAEISGTSPSGNAIGQHNAPCRCIAAHVIAMAMRVHRGARALVADTLRRRKQRQRQWRVAHVARVDQHMPVATLEQDVVGGQPVADEDVELRGKNVATCVYE
jgi:hypothetical protein